jgi:hypothetical protein
MGSFCGTLVASGEATDDHVERTDTVVVFLSENGGQSCEDLHVSGRCASSASVDTRPSIRARRWVHHTT